MNTRGVILRGVYDAIGAIHEEGWVFWQTVADLAPVRAEAHAIADRLGVCRTTFVSRFVRAGLPTPKELLVGWRLCLAARLFDEGDRTIADVACSLDFASPQSFNRHVRQWRGVRAGEFRERCPFNGELERYLGLIQPTAHRWADFRPITGARLTMAAAA